MLNFFDLVTTFLHNYELINIFVDIGLRILSKQTQLSISVHHKYVNLYGNNGCGVSREGLERFLAKNKL